MHNLYVPLSPEELDQLIEWARQERRRPQDQAAHILAEELRKRRGPTKTTRIGPLTLPTASGES
jgi:hypothetical protein